MITFFISIALLVLGYIFYGAMITEGIVALIWAAIGMAFYSGVGSMNEVMIANKGNAALVVNEISNSLFGKLGGALVNH